MNPCSVDSVSKNSSVKSNKTQLERCTGGGTPDSENLEEDDIRESLAIKNRHAGAEHQNQQSELPILETETNAMETPQLSDISSFNPDDPQVRTIEIETSSLSDIDQKSSPNKVEKSPGQNLPVSVFPKCDTEEEMSSEMSIADEVDQRAKLQ